LKLFIEFISIPDRLFVFIEKLQVLIAMTSNLYMRGLEIHLIG